METNIMAKTINSMINQRIMDTHTSYLGKIISIDLNLMTIQPLSMIKVYGEKAKTASVIKNIPVLFPYKCVYKVDEETNEIIKIEQQELESGDVFHQQKKAHEIMEKYGVQHESWGPFAEGRKDFFSNSLLNEIGAKYGKSAAQIALRFLIQSDVAVIPKSVHIDRMEQNINVFDFELSQEDMEAIKALDEKESAFFSHYDPETVEYITGLVR